jgi:O-antigen/teichoic acid export membrane protein
VITIDQALAGASNVLIAVLAARVLGVESFGLFGIVFIVYTMLQGVSRALVCDPLLVHAEEATERPGEAIGTSCVLGLGVAVVVLFGGIGARMWDARLGDALIVLALCAPLLVLQDLGRYLGFATRRPSSSVALDATWLGLLVLAVVALFATDHRSLAWFIGAWAGSGAVTGLLVFGPRRHRGARPGLAWLRFTWSFSWRYLISYSATQGAALVGSSAVGALSGARALGAVQGTILLARPYGTFQIAAVAAGVGEIARTGQDGRGVRRQGLRISGLTTAVALLNTAVMLVLPGALGRLVLGDTLERARPLLLATGVQLVCLGVITGARAGLLGARMIRKAMRIDVASTVLLLLATVSGASADGAAGALWGVALAQGVLAVVWWTVFWAHTAQQRAVPPAAEVPLAPAPVPSAPVPPAA